MARTRPEQAQAFAACHERITLVPRSGQGPNALNFNLTFYLGYMAAKHPDAELVVVATYRACCLRRTKTVPQQRAKPWRKRCKANV